MPSPDFNDLCDTMQCSGNNPNGIRLNYRIVNMSILRTVMQHPRFSEQPYFPKSESFRMLKGSGQNPKYDSSKVPSCYKRTLKNSHIKNSIAQLNLNRNPKPFRIFTNTLSSSYLQEKGCLEGMGEANNLYHFSYYTLH